VVLRAGVGTGLTRGFGSPELRALFSVGYEPPRDIDTDGDGLIDRVDECPTDPEDLDGIHDEDGCPDPTSVVIYVRDDAGKEVAAATHSVNDIMGRAGVEFMLPGGKYKVSVEAPGYEPLALQELVVPDTERHTVTYAVKRVILPAVLVVDVQDPEGKPIANATWSLRGGNESWAASKPHDLKAGGYTVRAAAEGYRPRTEDVDLAEGEKETLVMKLQPAKVELTAEKIDIKDSVYFETGKADIKAESFELLNEVAQIITEHPELTKIRVEGHTDSRGTATANLDLSKRRAAAVREYLVGRGVDASRLESEGFGESKPLVKGENEAAWSKNRRVDFFVVGRAD
jgi:outer membrane protein OmpA-like peptidoglycan-associated protein